MSRGAKKINTPDLYQKQCKPKDYEEQFFNEQKQPKTCCFRFFTWQNDLSIKYYDFSIKVLDTFLFLSGVLVKYSFLLFHDITLYIFVPKRGTINFYHFKCTKTLFLVTLLKSIIPNKFPVDLFSPQSVISL